MNLYRAESNVKPAWVLAATCLISARAACGSPLPDPQVLTLNCWLTLLNSQLLTLEQLHCLFEVYVWSWSTFIVLNEWDLCDVVLYAVYNFGALLGLNYLTAPNTGNVYAPFALFVDVVNIFKKGGWGNFLFSRIYNTVLEFPSLGMSVYFCCHCSLLFLCLKLCAFW